MRYDWRRLRRLERRARERLVTGVVEGIPAEAAEQTFEGTGAMDGQALSAMDSKTVRAAKARKKEAYRRLHAHYWEMPLLELLRTYVEMKCREWARLAKRRRGGEKFGTLVVAGTNESFEESARQERAYRESERWVRDNACNRG